MEDANKIDKAFGDSPVQADGLSAPNLDKLSIEERAKRQRQDAAVEEHALVQQAAERVARETHAPNRGDDLTANMGEVARARAEAEQKALKAEAARREAEEEKHQVRAQHKDDLSEWVTKFLPEQRTSQLSSKYLVSNFLKRHGIEEKPTFLRNPLDDPEMQQIEANLSSTAKLDLAIARNNNFQLSDKPLIDESSLNIARSSQFFGGSKPSSLLDSGPLLTAPSLSLSPLSSPSPPSPAPATQHGA